MASMPEIKIRVMDLPAFQEFVEDLKAISRDATPSIRARILKAVDQLAKKAKR